MVNPYASGSTIFFRVHAIQRMFERRISVEEVLTILAAGEVVEEYPGDSPYPSRLILGWSGKRPIHIVAAHHSIENQEIIITVYEPDPAQWEANFKRRRK